MQGKLSEIDIRSILQLVELGQRTGELFVEAYGMGSIVGDAVGSSALRRASKRMSDRSWFVFFINGQIIYAGDSGGNLTRLRDHLRRYKKPDNVLDNISVSSIATVNAPEYGHLWALLENHILTPAQGRSIIQSMVHETLFDLLSFHQGSFIFEIGPALSPQLTTLEIGPLLVKIIKQVQEWKQFHPHIQSPDQCPVISDPTQLREALNENAFKMLGRWVDGKTSIRQMARYLNRDILTVAKAIYPYVQQGLVQLLHLTSEESLFGRRNFDLPQQDKVPRIVCIDDGATIRKAVEFILNEQGYEATAISNPVRALSLVFQLKPDLILCDIAMPELDGYEICAMLRKSTAFRQTPIVMLTGKEGFIDRVKARMVGATDYLTKPFGENELLMLVEKYVGLGYPDRPRPDRLLAEALEDELEIDIPSASTSSKP
ncbi:response regulator [Leptolyngbya sp. FACHB-541]|uniref:response regulator n=1 Tax=Leptolyngbya sp. FACHB-541 TaxID=2692810 RepID=UPI001685FA52|nr:response regulator [Leptolyngbya sp. FACHB-541]MBD1869601.1 response regulator [Cyanobacteria bacterium FACHB-471]MBD1997099.1 response regulator [Leptolyngbya sp. FACHB-541]